MADVDVVVAVLGNGPCTETRLTFAIMQRTPGGSWGAAEMRTKNAIVEAVQAKRVEMFLPGCYRLTAGAAQMEKADNAS